MMDFKIREIRPTEMHLMKTFLYEAIFQTDNESPLSKDIINEPKLRVYIDDFGKRGNYCLVADVDGVVVGMVWTRILAGEIKGFGNIDEHTPELAISLYKEYRNMGMGTALMNNMLQLLKNQGYERTSLSVQKDNYAVRMYKKVGFEIVRELNDDYIMVRNWKGRL